MTIATPPIPRGPAAELHSGDRMSQAEFHRLYEQTLEDFKAELIGGTVYVASPLKLKHGTSHPWLSALLFAYQVATPGVELGDNATVILGDDSEPQPDLFLRILPEHGGLSRNSPDGYVDGPPELVVEIAHSSKSIDLHAKLDDYARCGVPEYLVYSVDDRQLLWFDLQSKQKLTPPPDGILKIRQFPGLWIASSALFDKDHARTTAVLQQGLATQEHDEFLQRLK